MGGKIGKTRPPVLALHRQALSVRRSLAYSEPEADVVDEARRGAKPERRRLVAAIAPGTWPGRRSPSKSAASGRAEALKTKVESKVRFA